MTSSIQAEDPGAHVLPYCLSAGTDNKPLSSLGISGYGFVPLQLPADLDFAPLFHGVDERVPVDAVRFGARVLLRLARDCCPREHRSARGSIRPRAGAPPRT